MNHEPEQKPVELLAGLRSSASRITLRTKDLQRVLLYYGGQYLHMRDGYGHYLRSKRIGPGVYDCWLEETHDYAGGQSQS